MRLIDADKFLEKVKKDRRHEIYLHSWTADMVLERLDSWYAPTVQAIPKADYENRLKADLKAILVELQLEVNELWDDNADYIEGVHDSEMIIQQKINALKAESEEQGMTREEAREYLKRADVTVGREIKTLTAEALEMAIKALEQEPILDKIFCIVHPLSIMSTPELEHKAIMQIAEMLEPLCLPESEDKET